MIPQLLEKEVQNNHRKGRETDNTRNSIQNSIEGKQHPVAGLGIPTHLTPRCPT